MNNLHTSVISCNLYKKIHFKAFLGPFTKDIFLQTPKFCMNNQAPHTPMKTEKNQAVPTKTEKNLATLGILLLYGPSQ